MKKTYLLFKLMALLLLATSISRAQNISPYLFGQNSWMPYAYGAQVYSGQLDQVWGKVRDSKVQLIRIGGIGPDFNRPTNGQYIALIDSIRKIGAEPLVQVPYGRGLYSASEAAAIVTYINKTMNRKIKYWSISNEPNLPAEGQPAVSIATIEAYIKSFSSAMKAVDPSILICGPDCAWYDASYYNALIGGSNDITGRDANGNFYVDIITVHTYPFSGTQSRNEVIQQPVNGFEGVVNALMVNLNAANLKNGRTGTNVLRWALTEFNVNYLNPAQNTVEGVGCHSYLNGQFWAEYFGIGMKYGAFSIMPWSIHESAGGRGSYDLGYLDNSTTFNPRSCYYHEKMMAENFKGSYKNSSDNQYYVKTFAAADQQQIAVLVMNQESTTSYSYKLQLNSSGISGASLLINVDANVNRTYTDAIAAQTTCLLLFNASGDLIQKQTYSLQHAQNNLPPDKQTITQQQLPYTTVSLPGTFQAENYDLGGAGVAFGDVTTGNSGNVYRIDHVDIEATTDAGAGYNVGWMDAGDWLEYTVNVAQTANYQLTLRTASLNGGGQLRLYANGIDLTGLVTIPSTGGWQNWTNVAVKSNSALPAGSAVLRLEVITGGFNLNYVSFAISSTNQSPTVSLTNPLSNASFNAPAAIALSATASDSDGSISKVEFFNGTSLLATLWTSPYAYSWNNVPAGTYSFTARATDNNGAITTSAPVTVVVNSIVSNLAPMVSLTAPANNASFTAPASITISANASDSDGSITQVDFYNGTMLLGSDNTAPYSINWTIVAAGNYTITAKATDNAGGTASASLSINVATIQNTCSGIIQFVENGGYVAGSKVQNAGKLYQCKPWPYSGWCNGAAWAYAPGTGLYWSDAWIQVGTCAAARLSSSVATCEALPNPASGKLYLYTTMQSGSAVVLIVDLYGTIVLERSVKVFQEGVSEEIDISTLPAGTFLVKLYNSDGMLSTRILVK